MAKQTYYPIDDFCPACACGNTNGLINFTGEIKHYQCIVCAIRAGVFRYHKMLDMLSEMNRTDAKVFATVNIKIE